MNAVLRSRRLDGRSQFAKCASTVRKTSMAMRMNRS